MTDQERVIQLIKFLEEIKSQLDTECCQTLMDADSISTKIEKIIKEVNT